MNCPDDETLSALVDGELDDANAALVRQHVEVCPTCRGRLEELRCADGTFRGLFEAIQPPGVEGALRRLRRRVLRSRRILAVAASVALVAVAASLLVYHLAVTEKEQSGMPVAEDSVPTPRDEKTEGEGRRVAFKVPEWIDADPPTETYEEFMARLSAPRKAGLTMEERFTADERNGFEELAESLDRNGAV
ncbi:MAG: anti-sigma factor family protein [Planctomycetota bacterium]|jgi:hypothetical protein